jgi:hypothetical protein
MIVSGVGVYFLLKYLFTKREEEFILLAAGATQSEENAPVETPEEIVEEPVEGEKAPVEDVAITTEEAE